MKYIYVYIYAHTYTHIFNMRRLKSGRNYFPRKIVAYFMQSPSNDRSQDITG